MFSKRNQRTQTHFLCLFYSNWKCRAVNIQFFSPSHFITQPVTKPTNSISPDQSSKYILLLISLLLLYLYIFEDIRMGHFLWLKHLSCRCVFSVRLCVCVFVCVCVKHKGGGGWIQYSLNVLTLATFSILPPWVHASFDSIRDFNFQSKPSLTDLFPGAIALCLHREEENEEGWCRSAGRRQVAIEWGEKDKRDG